MGIKQNHAAHSPPLSVSVGCWVQSIRSHGHTAVTRPVGDGLFLVSGWFTVPLYGTYLPSSLTGKCLRVAFAASQGTRRFSKQFSRVVPNGPPAGTHGGLADEGLRGP